MLLAGGLIVAKNKKSQASEARDRIDLRAEPDWVARVTRQARRLGISASAYIRLATSERLERDEASEPSQKSRLGD